MRTTFDRVRDHVAQQASWREPAEPINVESPSRLIEDCGLDSVDHVELILALEEEFGVSITDDEMEALRTVADAVALVDQKLVDIAA